MYPVGNFGANVLRENPPGCAIIPINCASSCPFIVALLSARDLAYVTTALSHTDLVTCCSAAAAHVVLRML